jgi:hypothetical protein
VFETSTDTPREFTRPPSVADELSFESLPEDTRAAVERVTRAAIAEARSDTDASFEALEAAREEGEILGRARIAEEVKEAVATARAAGGPGMFVPSSPAEEVLTALVTTLDKLTK